MDLTHYSAQDACRNHDHNVEKYCLFSILTFFIDYRIYEYLWTDELYVLEWISGG
jgi:hypothetical protein